MTIAAPVLRLGSARRCDRWPLHRSAVSRTKALGAPLQRPSARSRSILADDFVPSQRVGGCCASFWTAPRAEPAFAAMLARLRQFFAEAAEKTPTSPAPCSTGAGDRHFAAGGDLRGLAAVRAQADRTRSRRKHARARAVRQLSPPCRRNAQSRRYRRRRGARARVRPAG